MMTLYCLPEHVADLILSQVVEAAEALNADLVARSIENATGEVQSILSARYKAFSEPVPEIIRWITSVIAAWRVVGAITSLMDTEASSDNQWLPIQKQYERAWALLDDLAKGRTKLATVEGQDPDKETPHFSVISPAPYFNLRDF